MKHELYIVKFSNFQHLVNCNVEFIYNIDTPILVKDISNTHWRLHGFPFKWIPKKYTKILVTPIDTQNNILLDIKLTKMLFDTDVQPF